MKTLNTQIEKYKEEFYKMTMQCETLQLDKDKLAKKLEAAREDVQSGEKRIQELLSSNSDYGQSSIQRFDSTLVDELWLMRNDRANDQIKAIRETYDRERKALVDQINKLTEEKVDLQVRLICL